MQAVEPNACYLPLWALAVAEHARGRGGALALIARDRSTPERLTGLMPVRWARQALSLPVPLLVSWNAYAPFSVPLLDRDNAEHAAGALIDAARAAGARALLLQSVATSGPAYAAIAAALAQRGLSGRVMRSYRRAGLDAQADAEATLRAALSIKKLKELRRQRNRLEDNGAVMFETASAPDRIGPALEAFLALEARGWKGHCGTALIQHPGDAAFIRQAAPALAARGQFEVVSLCRNGETLAAGLILRDRGRAFFFKIAMDENEARTSPGVQLTLDLTRHLCADPAVAFADSSADGEHPMIDHVWRERITIADVLIALSPRDPAATVIQALLSARYRAINFVKTLRRIRERLP
ncbi:GNAT family N-acetyltransferase [Pseudorhodoplanes sp.]|uniref:GNAT family N-acetyltransferase n=1 Tax=Pseudorhodoplanes sp. TaxID=1934341 RepID=UPI003D14B59C